MPAQLFRNAEEAFSRWLQSNPDGYVVNTTTRPSQTYFVLHRAQCTTLHRDVPPGGYTEREFVKACSSDPSPSSLEAWIHEQGGPGFTKVCAVCKPETNGNETISAPLSVGVFEQQVADARRLTSAQRAARLPPQNVPPAFYKTTTIAFVRSPYVVAEVLERADGVCERCNRPAPFIRASDDTPYLEVHHKIRLADGGFDTVENAIAVCPNCHRQCHHGRSDG